MKVLVTGAGGSAAFNFVDALRQSSAQFDFVATDMSPHHLELLDGVTRYLVPSAAEGDEYIAALNEIIEREEIDFVHPQPDSEVAFLSRRSKELFAPTFLPEAEVVDLCQDKMRFNEAMDSNGVAVPKAFTFSSPTELPAVVGELLQRQPKAWLRAIRGAGARASLPIHNVGQAESWIDYWHSFRGLDAKDFMMSEFLPGSEYAWQSLWRNGELVCSQARERLAYIFGNLTPSGQTSSPSIAKTVNSDIVNETGEAAVRAAAPIPNGVFCVDMKEDAEGLPRVTEINAGRFFTTSNFFAHAGLNMPEMYVRLGVDQPIDTSIPKYNALKEDLYWVRMIDMGFKLVDGESWSATQI